MMMFRVATVKATGKKYLVNYIDFRTNKVTCWGEVVKRVNLKTTHGPNKVFTLDAVDIAPEAPKTEALIRELVNQMLDGAREEGRLTSLNVSRSGKITYSVKRK